MKKFPLTIVAALIAAPPVAKRILALLEKQADTK
jgi:hypothetical protein